MSFYFQSREWMDQRIDPESNQVSEIFLGGVDAFIQFACNQEDYKERETLLCPCARCKNVKQREARFVARHLFLYGFKENYYFWTSHGEKFNDVGESSGANHSTGEEEMLETPIWNAYEDHHQNIPEDDRRDQVAESSLLRVETHVVDDVSDYDLAPVNPPNDEYVSDVERKKRQTLSLDSQWNGSSPLRFLCRRLRFNLAVSDSIRRLRFHLPPLMMNSTRAPGTQAASPPTPPGATGPAVYHAGSPLMPPGATGAAPNHAASSSRSNSYPQMTLNAMLNSPARLSQPHLHPDKPNGALWFGIDPCIHAFIRATWQGYYIM
ncbi:hypothetical protein IGI04_019395 [Brassica rapa subsp. trilocularis]|uniref:Transposase-associated domain-containing protein n=1 Tax=Brassica rapa subsp. trilocularis TaxID=1813537 RepID=A0ABQ7MJ55_BRACM|nr:hypothetical protein IGI04_019395 [Brassica rapa subsp. trilocularis]